MELSDDRTPNRLESSFVGFVIVDDRAVGNAAEVKARAAVERRYDKFVEKEFSSPEYKHDVTVEVLSPAPEADEVGGEFRLIMSIVIAFERFSCTS